MLQDAVRCDDDTPTQAAASALCTPLVRRHTKRRAATGSLTSSCGPLLSGLIRSGGGRNTKLNATGRSSPRPLPFPAWVTLDSTPGLSVPWFFHRSDNSTDHLGLTTGVPSSQEDSILHSQSMATLAAGRGTLLWELEGPCHLPRR